MRVLITHECSGIVRAAFAKRGHYAISVDILPTMQPTCAFSEHYEGRIEDFARSSIARMRRFDLMISHPVCTWVCGSGLHWNKRGRQGKTPAECAEETRKAVEHVKWLMGIDMADRVCIENPIGILSTAIRKPEQIIQPNWFGHDASKATCLWLDDLPPLVPTKLIAPRMVNGRPRWANQTDSGQNKLGPSDDRWLLRAATYPGIADAFAEQWGKL